MKVGGELTNVREQMQKEASNAFIATKNLQQSEKSNTLTYDESKRGQESKSTEAETPASADTRGVGGGKQNTTSVQKTKGRKGNRIPKSNRKTRNPQYLKAQSIEPESAEDVVLQAIIGGGVKFTGQALYEFFYKGRRGYPQTLKEAQSLKLPLIEVNKRIGLRNDKTGSENLWDVAQALYENQKVTIGFEKYEDGDFINAVEDALLRHNGTRTMVESLNNKYAFEKYSPEQQQAYEAYLQNIDIEQYEQEDIDGYIEYWETLTDEQLQGLEKGKIAIEQQFIDAYFDNLEQESQRNNELEQDNFLRDENGNILFNSEAEQNPNRLKTIPKERFQKLLSILKKAFPKVGINLISNQQAREILGDYIDNASKNYQWETLNNNFNYELQQLINGTLPKGHIFELGNPLRILKSVGMPDLPIQLSATRLKEKSLQKEHPFNLNDVTNLVEAIQNPIAVFNSETEQNSVVILTELKQGNNNFVVAVELNKKTGTLEVNSIRSIYPRRNFTDIINWINNKQTLYKDEVRLLEYIQKNKSNFNIQQRYNSADVNTKIGYATKLIKEFENPKQDDTEFQVEYDDYRMEHKAPNKDDTPLYSLEGAYGEDIYTNKAHYYFGDNAGDFMDRQSIAILQSLKGKPNAKVTVYRAVPKIITNTQKIVEYEKQKAYILKNGKIPNSVTNWNKKSEYYEFIINEIEKLKEQQTDNKKVDINNGDWVSINKKYAIEHGVNHLNNQYRILQKTVLASQVFTDGNSIHEQGVQFLKTKTGTIYGFVKDGQVYIIDNKLNANTPIHEFAHVWQQMFPAEFKRGILLLKASKKGRELIKKIALNPAYATDSKEAIEAEALVTAIGDMGEIIFNDNKSLLAKFKEWVKDLFTKISDALNKATNGKLGTAITPDMLLDEFAKNVVGELLGGKELKGESQAKISNKKGSFSEDTDNINFQFEPNNPTHVQLSAMLNNYIAVCKEVGDVPTKEEIKEILGEQTYDKLISELGEEFIDNKINPPKTRDIDLSNQQKGEKRDKALIQRAERTFGKEAENELNEIGRKYTSDNWKEIEPRVDAYAKKVYASSNFKEEVDNIINWIKNTTSGEYTDKKGLATAQTMLLNKLIMYSYNTDNASGIGARTKHGEFMPPPFPVPRSYSSL